MNDRYVYSLWPTGDSTQDMPNLAAAINGMTRGQLVIRDNGKELLLDPAHGTIPSCTKPVFFRGETSNVTIRFNNWNGSFGNYHTPFNWGGYGNPVLDVGTPFSAPDWQWAFKLTAPGHGLSEGDWIVVISDDDIPGIDGHSSFLHQRPAELVMVDRISGDDLYINTPLCDVYQTNARFVKLDMIPNCGMADLQLAHNNEILPPSTTDMRVIDAYRTIGLRIENLAHLYDGAGFTVVDGSAQARVQGFRTLHMHNNFRDYGIVVGTVNDMIVSDFQTNGTRHVTSTTGWNDTDRRYGNARNLRFRNMHAVVPDNGHVAWVMYDTHAEGYGVTYESCHCDIAAESYQGYAFNTRSRATRWVNCSVTGGQFQETITPKDDIPNFHTGFYIRQGPAEIINCRTENICWGVNVIRMELDADNHPEDVLVKDCFFKRVFDATVIWNSNNSGKGLTYMGNTHDNCGSYHGSSAKGYAILSMNNGGNHRIILNDFQKENADYMLFAGQGLTTADFDISGNTLSGWGANNWAADLAIDEVTAVDTATDELTIADASSYVVDDDVEVRSTGELPAPLLEDETYYIAGKVGNDLTLKDDLGNPIDITTTGSGTITITRWFSDIAAAEYKTEFDSRNNVY